MEFRGPDSNGAAGPLPRPEDRVRLVRWPDEGLLLEQLRAQRVPRVLLVTESAPPPAVADRDEEWVRLPADDEDIRVRMAAVAARGARHQPVPQVGDDGRLKRANGWIALSPIELRLARELIENFGEVVESSTLTQAAWPGNGHEDHDGALRVHLTRLRRRLRPLALDVQNVRGRGYLVEHSELEPHQH